jgi:hypothetical protein
VYRKAWLVAVGTVFGCHAPVRGWADLSRTSGCTPALIASAPRYQGTNVQTLAGRYALVQIDTARGWFEFEREYGTVDHYPTLTLWPTDSLHRFSRVSPLTTRRIPADIPLMGALSGYEHAGFTADRPQVEVSAPDYYLVVRFQPGFEFDAPLWELPIQRQGSWGFGGYFAEAPIVLPVGKDGRALGQRAGFYCALKR